MFNRFPYTNFHNLNLDWIISKIKGIENTESSTKAYMDAANAAADAAGEYAGSAQESAESASASAAVIPVVSEQISTLTTRLNSLIMNGQPTEGNTELIDIRAGGDGVNYPTAGDAVRGQYSVLKKLNYTVGNDIYAYDGTRLQNAIVGSNIGSSGNINSNPARMRTGQILRGPRKYIALPLNDYQMSCFGYDATGGTWSEHYLGTTGWLDIGAYFIVPESWTYYALTFKRVDEAEMSNSDREAILNAMIWKTDIKFLRNSAAQIHFTLSISTGNCRSVLALPDIYEEKGQPVKLIVFCHGNSGYVGSNNWQGNNDDLLAMLDVFKAAGYAILDTDSTARNNTGNTDVGNPELMEGYIKTIEYVQKNYNVENVPYIYGCSFGTFTALNLMAWYPGRFKAAAITGPRFSVKAIYDRGGNYASQILSGFDMGSAYDSEKTLGFDLYQDMRNGIIEKQVQPVLFIRSDADNQDSAIVTEAISALHNAGTYLTVKNYTDYSHHDLCYLTSNELQNDVIDYLAKF